MGEVAGMAARFLRLRFAMGEQLVDLFGQRVGFRDGNSSAIRVFSPERISATSRRTRRSGHRP